MTQTIKVIDYIMGARKSSYVFEMINNSPNKRFIYETPLLSEAEERAVGTVFA